MKHLQYIVIALSIVSCKTENHAENPDKVAIDSTAFRKQIQPEEKPLKLDSEAREYALQWVEYITAQNEIEKIKNSSVEEVMSNAPAIAQIMQTLKTSVPDSLKAVPVEARLNVVNTKAQLLRVYSKKRDPDPEIIAQTANELYVEFNNLKLQMNEIFLKSLEDFEKELDELEEENDSIKADTLKRKSR